MTTLLELTQQLAEGTSRDKRWSWTALVVEPGLWSLCRSVLHGPAPLRQFDAAFGYLSGDWNRSPLTEGDPAALRQVEDRLGIMRRIVAAAAVTAASQEAVELHCLWQWMTRAVGETCAKPETAPDRLPLGSPRCRIRAGFRELASVLGDSSVNGRNLASAQDASLDFLSCLATEEPGTPGLRLNVPILLARGEEGFLAWLCLERRQRGFGQIYQAPESLLNPLLPDLRNTIESGCAQARAEVLSEDDVRWWLIGLPEDPDGVLLPVGGCSAATAAAVGVAHLLSGNSIRRGCAVTATLGTDGKLGPVEGLRGSGPKLAAARRGLAAEHEEVTVFVARESQLTAIETAGWEARGVRIVPVDTLGDAIRHTQGAPLVAEGWATQQRLPSRPRLVLLYVRESEDDCRLRDRLEPLLRARGYEVDVDVVGVEGLSWACQARQRIDGADQVLVLVTSAAATSETLACEVEFAHETYQQERKPRLVVLLAGASEPPRALSGSAYPVISLGGSDPSDIDPCAGLDERLPELMGWLERPDEAAMPECRDASLSVIERDDLAPPTGVLPLDSDYYLARNVDRDFRSALVRRDSIVRIKGARQMGKTSLLARGLQQARNTGSTVILTDFQLFNQSQFQSVETFLLALARQISRHLPKPVDPKDLWDPLQGASVNFRDFLLEVLPQVPGPVVWGLDEVDRLFTCEFRAEVFGLLRSLHNERALNPTLPWSRLTLILCYATEAHLFLADLNQSPFNVGTRLPLGDFSRDEVAELNRRYGAPLRGAAELGILHNLLEGHPYLTHRSLHALASRSLTLAELQSRAVREDSLFGDHLRRLLLLLARDSNLAAAVGEILRGRPCPSPESFFRLWSAGVVVGDSVRDARLRCRLYASYLERHLS